MIRNILFNQESTFWFEPQTCRAGATIKGYDRNGIFREEQGTAYGVTDEVMAFQTLNSFFEEELNMKYEYTVEFGQAQRAQEEMEAYIESCSSHLTGEKTWTT